MVLNKLKIALVFSFIISILLFGVYINSKYYITAVKWKYNSGYHVGDLIDFTHTEFMNNTIFIDSKAVAKIKFCYFKGMFIQNIITRDIGRYEKKSF